MSTQPYGRHFASSPRPALPSCLRALIAIALVSLLALGSQPVTPARAGFGLDLHVDRFDDALSANTCSDLSPNDCSLRGAIHKANHTAGIDTINLPAGTCTLTIPAGAIDEDTGDLDILEGVTIIGAGAATTTINGNGGVTLDRVLQVHGSANTTLRNLKIAGGNTTSSGGGVLTWSSLTLENVVVDGNLATSTGGGIYTSGAMLTLTNTTVSNNSSGTTGGGIYALGTGTSVVIAGSTITGNHAGATASGGGLYLELNITSATISDTTISNNTAGAGAG